MKTATRLFALAVLVSGTFFVSSSLACTTDAWSSATAGATPGDPSADGIARVSGFCGLEVTGTGQVVDNSPAAETTFIARFYVFPKNLGAGPYEIFVALSNEADVNSDVFVVSYDGANINLDATAVGGGTASVAADTTHWNLVEVAWTSGDTGSLWVNSDATVDPADATFASGTGAVEQVRLGAVDGVGADTALVDDYESHRSLAVGPLLQGDGNNDGAVNSGDIISIINEFFDAGLSSGTPDCNMDGNVNSGDIICIINTFFAP